MGPGRKFVLLVMAAGLLRAADSPDLLYKFHLAHPATRVEFTATRMGAWDVTVTVNPATCELVCAYRMRRQSPAVHLIAPPTVVVHAYADGVSLPQTVTIDPAGLSLPSIVKRDRITPNSSYLPGRKLMASAPRRTWNIHPGASWRLESISKREPLCVPTALLPLRI